jgi:hypothetical protein
MRDHKAELEEHEIWSAIQYLDPDRERRAGNIRAFLGVLALLLAIMGALQHLIGEFRDRQFTTKRETVMPYVTVARENPENIEFYCPDPTRLGD